MSDPVAVAAFIGYRNQARAIFPLLNRYAIVDRLNDGSYPSWEHFNVAGIPQYHIPDFYNVDANQTTYEFVWHECGHEFDERLSQLDPTKKHHAKFMVFIGQTVSWDAQKAVADAQTTANAQHAADPGEWWAEAFRRAVHGVGTERTFFLSLIAGPSPVPTPTPTPVPPSVLPFTDFMVPAGNYYSSRDGTAIDTIILHTTVGTRAASIARFQNPAAQVSPQWLVNPDGSLDRGVEEQFTAYHAGDWGENLRSIGIEHVDDGNYDGVRPDALYATASRLVAEIRARHPITRLLTHRDVYATRCPDALDVARIYAGGIALTLTADDKKYIDQRIRDVVMNEDIATFAVRNALSRELGNKGAAAPRVPDTNMKGTPPKGHPAA